MAEPDRNIRRLTLLYITARIMAEAAHFDDAMLKILQAICEQIGYNCGSFWKPDEETAQLKCQVFWGGDAHRKGKFEEASRNVQFSRGVGLPGRVWENGSPAWIADVTKDPNFPRRAAAEAENLHGAFAFPVHQRDKTTGVIEFFSSSFEEPDTDLLETMFVVGSQVGLLGSRIQVLESLEEAIQVRSQFLDNVSHEIRTPLNGIIGTTDLLIRTKLNKEQEKFVQVIEASGNILLTLVNDLLDFSKIEAGKMELEIVDFSLLSAVESATEILAARAQEKKLSMVAYISPELPSVLKGDPGRIEQILLNLISNAIKFTTSGDIIIQTVPDPAGKIRVNENFVAVRFSVTDSGAGISEKTQRKLFEPFIQEASQRHPGGTGLGLSICKRLVESMKGAIGFESKEGQGSTFWFTLPLEKNAAQSKAIKKLHDLRGIHALIVGTRPRTSEILRSYLSSWGIEVDAVSDSSSAKKLFNTKKKYEIFLVDCPFEGAKILRQLKNQKTMKCIFLVKSKKEEEFAIKSGCKKILMMPYRQSDLFNSIASLLRNKKVLTEASKISPKKIHSAKGAKKILVVEDNPVNQMVALKQLAKLGYDAHAVANGKEAVEAVSSSHYDLVLMDCQMPVMDGFEATQEIRRVEAAKKKRTPIVALTAYALKGDGERCLAAGMDGYLTKPIRMEKLAEVTKHWLTQRSRKS